MSNQEKILEIIVNNSVRLYSMGIGFYAIKEHDCSKEIAQQFRPRLTVQQVKEAFEQLFNEQISFGKAA